MLLKLYFNEKGMALIELLMVLGILGLIGGAVFTFYLSGADTWQKGVDRMDHQQSARVAVDVIVRELRFANWVEIADEGREIHFSFMNDEGIYTFKRVGPDGEDLVFLYPYEGGTQQGKVALGITGLHFEMDDEKNIHIAVTAGQGARRVTMKSSVRPRNLP